MDSRSIAAEIKRRWGKKFTEAISITLINKAVLLKVLKSSGFGQVSGLLIVDIFCQRSLFLHFRNLYESITVFCQAFRALRGLIYTVIM